MIKSIVLLVFLGSLPVHAALSSKEDSLRRLGAVIQSREVHEALGADNWVGSVAEQTDGSYVLYSQFCTLVAKVEAARTNASSDVAPLTVTVTKLHCLDGRD